MVPPLCLVGLCPRDLLPPHNPSRFGCRAGSSTRRWSTPCSAGCTRVCLLRHAVRRRSLLAIAEWGRAHEAWCCAVFGFRRCTPCVSTLHRILTGLEVGAFETA